MREFHLVTIIWTLTLIFSASVVGAALTASTPHSQAQSSPVESRVRLGALACDSCIPALPASSATPTPFQQNGTLCLVTNVVDGDTFDVGNCADAGRVRLILVDTPEVFGGAECFGREASSYTSNALLGVTVRLERDVSNTDRYGRLLRYAWLGDTLFNEQIVRDGFAVLATFPPDVRYVDRIRDAQTEARNAERGLWELCGGADTPASPTSVPSTLTPPTPPTTPSTPGAPFSLPACYSPGANTCNCSDFSSHAHAQWFHDNYDLTDINRLDGSDRDGLVCEGL